LQPFHQRLREVAVPQLRFFARLLILGGPAHYDQPFVVAYQLAHQVPRLRGERAPLLPFVETPGVTAIHHQHRRTGEPTHTPADLVPRHPRLRQLVHLYVDWQQVEPSRQLAVSVTGIVHHRHIAGFRTLGQRIERFQDLLARGPLVQQQCRRHLVQPFASRADDFFNRLRIRHGAIQLEASRIVIDPHRQQVQVRCHLSHWRRRGRHQDFHFFRQRLADSARGNHRQPVLAGREFDAPCFTDFTRRRISQCSEDGFRRTADHPPGDVVT